MFLLPSASLLEETLRGVARRYRLPAAPTALPQAQKANPSTALAIVIEQVRDALARGVAPDTGLQRVFVDALARLIREAMRAEHGDPVFQAMALRHRAPQVREYASLSAQAEQDRRLIHAAVNAIAHPAKQQRMPPGPEREALARLHACAASASWTALSDAARQLRAMPDTAAEPAMERGLARLLDGPALGRLQRLDALAADALVQQYQSLWDRHSPRPGSPTAVAQGSAAQQRGATVEAQAARALEALARQLNEAQAAGAPYRVVTSMRVPSSIPASAERAKSEWDAVLLAQAQTADGAAPAWDVCLLVEAKASVDAATTDLPRLLRGLRLLAHADPCAVYPFNTRQGVVPLRGASLRALPTDGPDLGGAVLYCCDGPAEAAPRLLNAASRMQLLSAEASVAYAGQLAEHKAADPQSLAAVWTQLLESPQWAPVLNQYPALRQVRELMVHADDLLAAANGAKAI